MKVLVTSLIIVVIDQVTKLLVKGFSIPFLGINHTGMYPGQRISIIDSLLSISFVENPGIAFGIDFGIKYKLILSLFTFVATAALCIYLYRNRKKNFMLRLSLAFIIGGAVGNLVDRAFYGIIFGYAPFLYGQVVDFININFFHVFIFNKTFGNYVLNFADLAVTTGVILLLLSYNKIKDDTAETQTSPAAVETQNESENFLAQNKD